MNCFFGQQKSLSDTGRVARTTGSGWDPYTQLLGVPDLKVVRECPDFCRYLLFSERRNDFNYFFPPAHISPL